MEIPFTLVFNRLLRLLGFFFFIIIIFMMAADRNTRQQTWSDSRVQRILIGQSYLWDLYFKEVNIRVHIRPKLWDWD